MRRNLALITIVLMLESSAVSAAPACHLLFHAHETRIALLRAQAGSLSQSVEFYFRSGLFQNAAFELYRSGNPTLARELERWIEEELKFGEIKQVEEGEGDNLSKYFLITYASGMKSILKIAHKSAKGHASILESFTNPDNEIAAYHLDRLIQLQLVPATTKRKIDLTGFPGLLHVFGVVEGSVQAWVRNAYEPRKKTWSTEWYRSLQKLRIFDYLINNRDRHDGNIIWTYRQVAAIDNGAAFQPMALQLGLHPPMKLPNLPTDVRNIELFNALEALSEQDLVASFSATLTRVQLNELLARRQLLLAHFEENIASDRIVPDFEPEHVVTENPFGFSQLFRLWRGH